MTNILLTFPAERARPPAPDTRLAQALDQLATALAEQREAISAWRAALRDLKGASQQLGTSLGLYAGELSRLVGGVAQLHEASQQAQTLPG